VRNVERHLTAGGERLDGMIDGGLLLKVGAP
jgi:hypothetical protein